MDDILDETQRIYIKVYIRGTGDRYKKSMMMELKIVINIMAK